MSETKICARCGLDKPKSDYHKRAGKACGVQSKCKSCTSEYKKERYWSNHDEELAKMTKSRLKPENLLQRKEYYQNNKDDYKERHLRYMSDEDKRRQRNERNKEYYHTTIEHQKAREKKYKSGDSYRELERKRHHIRKQTDTAYIIKRRLRFRLRAVIDHLGDTKYKVASVMQLIGCDIVHFQQHIESLFTEGMTWDKVLSGEIHIDHKIPCAKFDLTKEEEQRACFHLSNLQPLWKEHNLKKGAKYNGVDYRYK